MCPDRRHTDRLPLARLVSVRSPRTHLLARTVDLTPAGCRLRCVEPLRVGTELRLSLQLGDEVYPLWGRVVRLGLAHDAAGLVLSPPDGGWDVVIEFAQGAELEYAQRGLRDHAGRAA